MTIPRLLTRAQFLSRKERINSWVLGLYLGGFLLGCLVPIGGMLARSLIGSTFPESAVRPTLAAMVGVWVAGPLFAILAPPLLVRTLGLRCAHCGCPLADRRGWARVRSPGLCPACGQGVFADSGSIAAAFQSREAFIAMYPVFSTEHPAQRRRSALLWVWTLSAALGVGGTVAVRAALPVIVGFATVAALGAMAIHHSSRASDVAVTGGVSCPSCRSELVNVGIRRQRELMECVLSTGVCPFCATPLFSMPAAVTR